MKKKARKTKATRKVRDLPAKSLSAKSARRVRGGSKSKGSKGNQQEYIKITMKDALISG